MRQSTITGFVTFAVVLSVHTVVAAPKPPAPARRLAAPEHVSAEVRQQVKARMGQHAATMESLVRAVVLLDRPTIRVLAGRIADEEVIAQTTGIRHKQPPVLPAKFFAEQDALAAAARQLAAAAIDGGEDAALAERFAAVTRTCIGCHSTYMHDAPAPQPVEQKPATR
jgi:hypothetical protein